VLRCTRNSLTHSLTHSLAHPLTHSLSLSLSIFHSLALSLSRSFTLSLFHFLALSLSLSLFHSLSLTHSLSLSLSLSHPSWNLDGNVDETEWLRMWEEESHYVGCQIPAGQPLVISNIHGKQMTDCCPSENPGHWTTIGSTVCHFFKSDEYHCPPGWSEPWAGYCYLLVTEEKAWSDARIFCSHNKTGADLVSIGSLLEQEFVYGQ
jgi:hypothetical protein